MSSPDNRPRLLFLTPTFTGGSGIVIEELVKKLADRADILVLGLGPGRNIPGVKTIKIHYFLFDNIRGKYGSNVFFNALYQTPLWLISAVTILVLSFRFKPKVVVSNGFTPLLLSMFVTKAMGITSIVYYGSFLERVIQNLFLKFLFSKLNYFVDYAFVNSVGSAQDLGRIIKPGKIITIEHWTAMEPAVTSKVAELKIKHHTANKFVILYVGKFSPDKSFGVFLELARRLSYNKSLVFWFIGTGELMESLKSLTEKYGNVQYLGYFQDRQLLGGYISAADVTLSYADVTYLGMPATESLACGTPIIISDRPALLERMNTQATIDNKLVPNSIGWILDTHDINHATQQLKDIINKGPTSRQQRFRCRAYALEKYSDKNLVPALKLLLNNS